MHLTTACARVRLGPDSEKGVGHPRHGGRPPFRVCLLDFRDVLRSFKGGRMLDSGTPQLSSFTVRIFRGVVQKAHRG